jgi:hypothetical protein
MKKKIMRAKKTNKHSKTRFYKIKYSKKYSKKQMGGNGQAGTGSGIQGIEYNYISKVWESAKLGGIPNKPLIWEKEPGKWHAFVGNRKLNEIFYTEESAKQEAINYFKELERINP